jgi:signal transduction histidine kinase
MEQELIDALSQRHIGLDVPTVARALTQHDPMQVADLKEEAATSLNKIILSAGYRALLVAPLLRGDEVVGVLVIRRRTPGRFAQNTVDLIKTFTAHSALAIQNARLFESVEARTRELAKSFEMLQRERNNKLMNLEAMAASISHEVAQPLSAITSNGSAALRLLVQEPPNLEGVGLALNRMVRDGHRAGQVLDKLRALFGKIDQGQEPIDVNELAREVLQALGDELKDHGITTQVDLTSQLPLVMGHRGQLQEVFINLVHNAIETMAAISDDRRVLQLSTEHHGSNAVIVAVEDSGSGIDPKQLNRIFDAFVTTKPNGIGLGLTISRLIVERHDGQISASSAHSRGSVFQVVLPAGRHGAE